jgi:hypothetical protein
VAALAFFLEQPPLDDRLGGDAGVVGAGHPQGVVALHPLCMRMRMSCSVLFRACPRCRAPVTLGGGMTIVYGFAIGIGLAVEVALLLPERDTIALGAA